MSEGLLQVLVLIGRRASGKSEIANFLLIRYLTDRAPIAQTTTMRVPCSGSACLS